MRSSWLLFKTQRRRLFSGAGISLVGSMFIASIVRQAEILHVRMHADELSFGPWAFPILAFLAPWVFTVLGNFRAGFYAMPFPVTERQIAWVPTVCSSIVWMSGFIGFYGSMIGISMIWPTDEPVLRWMPFHAEAFGSLPFVLFMFAFQDRALRFSTVGAFFLTLFTAVMLLPFFEIPFEYTRELLQLLWPLFLSLGAFFILVAPWDIRSIRHETRITNERTEPYSLAPHRSPVFTVIASVVTRFIIAGALYWSFPFLYAFGNDASFEEAGWTYFFENHTWLKYEIAGFTIILFLSLLQGLKETKANGFGRGKSVLMYVLGASHLLEPVTDLLGRKYGPVLACEQCRYPKFTWATRCPKCNDENHGYFIHFLPLQPKDQTVETIPGIIYAPSYLGYRVIAFVLLGLFLATSIRAEFDVDVFPVVMGRFSADGDINPSNPIPPPEMISLREQLADIDDVDAWLLEVDWSQLSPMDGFTMGIGGPPGISDRYRIEVEENEDYIEVKCYTPATAEPSNMGFLLKARLLELLPRTDRVRYGYPSGPYEKKRIVNRLTLPIFFDNRIHWVD